VTRARTIGTASLATGGDAPGRCRGRSIAMWPGRA
jgi:hypothetical protein